MSDVPPYFPTAEKHWSYFNKPSPYQCWEWKLTIGTDGYGAYSRTMVAEDGSRRSVFIYAHRASYVFAYGAVAEGKVVGHACDNRPCGNPLHLVELTNGENIKDVRRDKSVVLIRDIKIIDKTPQGIAVPRNMSLPAKFLRNQFAQVALFEDSRFEVEEPYQHPVRVYRHRDERLGGLFTMEGAA